MDEIDRSVLPAEVRELPVFNWRTWQYLEAMFCLSMGWAICRNCGHPARRHGDFILNSDECMDCAEIQSSLLPLPSHAVNGRWVGFKPCRKFAEYDPLVQSALRLPGYALTVEAQQKRDEERAKMPVELW